METTAEGLVHAHHQVVDRAIRRLDPPPTGRRTWSRLTAAGRAELERAAREYPAGAPDQFESFALRRVTDAIERVVGRGPARSAQRIDAGDPIATNRLGSMLDHPSFR